MEYTARSFSLPKEIPGLSSKQVELHLGLYAGYIKQVNHHMLQMRSLAMSDTDFTYALNELRRRLSFEWNGMHLHELYFEALEQGPTSLHADSKLYQALVKQYGGLTDWLTVFKKVAARGPGWALLTYDPQAQHFFHVWVSDHEVGHLGSLPIIVALDHWEHAYLVDYAPSEKGKYVDAYLSALNWDVLAKRFDAVA